MSKTIAKLKSWWQKDETREQGERLGFGVALALSILAAVSMYRGMEARMHHLAMASAVLLCLGIVAPRLLAPAAWAVERLFQLVVKITLYIMLVIVFMIVFAPVGIAIRILRKDPLETKLDPHADSYWAERKKTDPQRAEKQF